MAALRYLTGSVTQASADAFAIAQLATALSGATSIAYRIRELLLEIPRVIPSANTQLDLVLLRRTKTSMPNITDADVIQKVRIIAETQTSGGVAVNGVQRLLFGEDDDVLVVEDPLFFACDSNNTALAQTFFIRIGYEQVKISEVDRLTILTRSLT